MSSDQSADDFFNTLTGYDELAIAKHFEQPLERLIPNPKTGAGSPFLFQRALAFVHLRRGGANDREAYKQAMELSIADANGYFEGGDDFDPDDPDSPAGKGPSPDA